MNEWWSYSLSDLLMFSARTYYRLFELYNLAIWPAQLVAGALGLAILACVARGGVASARAAAGLLAACWLWVAWAYHAERYATINSAATSFAFGFAIEALLLLWVGTVRGGVALAPVRGGIRHAALGLLLCAILGYPLLGAASGRAWRQLEMFGVAPDPTAIATLGLLLLSTRIPWLLLPIPLLWCAVSGATLWTMHARDAWVAPLAALLALLLAVASASLRDPGKLTGPPGTARGRAVRPKAYTPPSDSARLTDALLAIVQCGLRKISPVEPHAMKTIEREKIFAALLDWTACGLFFMAISTTILIFFDTKTLFDPTPPGLASALTMFNFPINCMTGVVAILAIRITISALAKSGHQSAAAAWALIQSAFLAYATAGRILPRYSLNNDPFNLDFSATSGEEFLFEVKYLNPTVTLRRLYDSASFSNDLEPPPHPLLLKFLAHVDTNFTKLKTLLKEGNPLWLPAFVDLCVSTRQLRQYLVVTTHIIEKWNRTFVLEYVEEFGRKRMPAYGGMSVATISSNVRVELICVVNALHFVSSLEQEAQRLYRTSMSVALIWLNADLETKAIISETELGKLWNESYLLDGRRIEI